MSSALSENIRCSQNFLKDARLVAILLERSSIGPDDVVYEIGPGKGIITEQLARRCQRVVAIEKDPCLAAMLLQQFAARPNVTIHAGDFLEYPLPRKPYKVFASIPFTITAALVTRLTTAEHPPEDMYLVMQQEAAERFLGQPRETLRSLLLKPWFEMEVVHRFRRSDFVPAPQVDVIMLRLRKRGPPLVNLKQKQCYRDFVVYSFTAWQPMLGSILKGLFTRQQLKHLSRELALDCEAAPTAVTFEQWLNLFASFQKMGNEQAMRVIAGSERRLIRQQMKLEKIHRTRAHWRTQKP